MKISLILTLSTTIIITLSSVLSTSKVPHSILKAIENGSSKELATYFNQSICLLIDENSGVYNKQQAEILVDDFFENNEPVNFEVVDQQEQISSSFAICEIENSFGQKFSVYIMVRKFAGKSIITKMNIEKLE